MKLGELENPIRITWDLCGPGYAVTASDFETVLDRLLEAHPFFITLEEQPSRHPEFGTVVRRLSGNGVQVTAMTDGLADEVNVLSGIARETFELLLRVESYITAEGVDQEALGDSLNLLRQLGFSPGLSMMPLRTNINYIATLLDFCERFDIPRFKLPNIRIDDNFQAVKEQLLKPEDLEKFRESIADTDIVAKASRLEIHDLFLWELLSPDHAESRSEYGGCQAGNSLAHVKSNGEVWPCVSWPVPIGSLLTSSFAEIWMSNERSSVRQQISEEPDGCSGCCDYQICFGGCRGLSKHLAVKGGLDLMCGGPRET